MATVFEDRSSYVERLDPVATLTLTVECNPGEVANLSNFLVGVSAKGGVYSVAIDHVVAEPAKVNEGEAHGEQPIQQADPDHPGEDDGRAGHEASSAGADDARDAGAHGELAEPAGESGSGSLGGSA